MSNEQVTILESWKIGFRNEIRSDIQHNLNGLAPGTVLRSNQNGLTWKVVSRTIFIQADNQKRFKEEREVFEHIKFIEPMMENYEKFRSDIAEKESKGIHHYSIEPIGHDRKPENGEILDVEYEALECS
jgi:hypothetical protein